MKRAYFVCLFLCLTTTFLLSQSNPVPLVNQTARVLPPVSASQPNPKVQARILDNYGKLPLAFEANKGQTDGQVKFLSLTGGYTLFLTGDEAVLALSGTNINKAKMTDAAHSFRPGMAATKAGATLRMKLRNANPAAKVTGMDELAGTSNYFIGKNPAKWRTNVPTYAKVKFEGIYSGIDLVYYGNQRQLEYDFIVAPGADPRRIQFDVRGAKRIRQDAQGDLVLRLAEGEIRWHKPVVYQEKDGSKQLIAARYAITERNRVGFELAKYDASRPIYIDPLIYSTYLGGSSSDGGSGIAIDSAGNVYVTGTTTSTNFPTMNPLQPTCGGGCASNEGDAFVSKLNVSGSALVYSTYLGGSSTDYGNGIAVDSAGNAYVVGTTQSTDFPTTSGAFQTTCGGNACAEGWADAFVTKLNVSGSALVYSTYLGGSSTDYGNGIAVDSAGNAYLVGTTTSNDFPTMNPLQPTYGGGGNGDAFVTKLNPAGSALVYSTYLGGSDSDDGYGIALDGAGDAYVTGTSASTNFPTMNPLQASNAGGYDAFVAKLNSTGSALVYSTYLGGSGDDVSDSIVVDSSGNAYIAGVTTSNDFPTTPGAFQTICSGNNCGTWSDAFVAKLNPSGSAPVYSTYLGGSGADAVSCIAVDSAGNAYVVGTTTSNDFPTMNPLQPTFGGGYQDAFVTKLNVSGSALVYSTYLGGTGNDRGSGIAVDNADNAYVTGTTSSTNFPTLNPLQPAPGGGQYNAFVAKIGSEVSSATAVASSSNPSAVGQPVIFTATVTSEGSGTPTGTGTFTYGSTTLCNAVALTGGTATCTYSALPLGSDLFTATYSGDANFTPSSGSVTQTVNRASTTVGVTSSLNPSGLGQALTFMATISPQYGGQASGTVTFKNGAATLGSSSVNSNIASLTTSSLTVGTHSITAIYGGDSNFTGSTSLVLSQVVKGPAVKLSPTSLTFPTQVVFTTSKAKTVTLTNTGLGILNIKSIAVSGPFAQTNTCGTTVASGASCTFTVTFKPTTIGTLTGSVSLTDNAPASPQKIALTGIGTYAQLSPTSLNFGNQPTGTTSLAKTITLSNKGGVSVSITGISITGADPNDFSQTNTCGTSVAAGASCFIKVKFTPSATGTRTARVSSDDSGGGSPQKVTLAGTGT
jgi:hypothetical protein